MITGIKLLRRNAISNGFGIVVPALAWFIIVPVLVHHLGEDGYGIYTIAISFAGILGFLELGLTSAAIKFVAQVDIRDNKEKLEKLVSSNLCFYIGIGSVVTLLSVFLSPYIAPYMFPESGINRSELILVVKLIGIILSLTLLRNAISSVLMGLHRYDAYNGIQVSYAVILVVVQWAIVISGGQLVALMIGNIAVMVGSLIGFIITIHRLVPKIRLIRLPDVYSLRLLFSFGMYMMLINFAATTLFNVDKVIIGWILGPESVTYYAIPTQIALKIHNGLAVFVSFIFPLASEVKSIGDTATLKKIYLQSMRFILLIYALAMVFLGTFAREILNIWIDPNYAAVAGNILVLTSLGYIFFSLSIIPYHILLGIGKPRSLAILNIIAALSVIICLYFGLIYYGLIGGMVGVVVGMGSHIFFPWYAQRSLKISWGNAIKESYGRTIICAIGGILISIMLPDQFLIKTLFFSIFVMVFLVCGNTKKEDWRKVQGTWQQVITYISVIVRL